MNRLVSDYCKTGYVCCFIYVPVFFLLFYFHSFSTNTLEMIDLYVKTSIVNGTDFVSLPQKFGISRAFTQKGSV